MSWEKGPQCLAVSDPPSPTHMYSHSITYNYKVRKVALCVKLTLVPYIASATRETTNIRQDWSAFVSPFHMNATINSNLPCLWSVSCFINPFSFTIEPPHDKTNNMACAPSEDPDQPGHPPSLIRVFAVRMKKAWVLSYPLSTQQRLWSDWADAQTDLSLHCAQSFLLVLSRGGAIIQQLSYWS